MLRTGRDWKGQDGYMPTGWKPKKVRRHVYLDGYTFTEPDPRRSNKSTTGTLAFYAREEAGWTAEQFAHEMSKEENLGGAYFRFRMSSDSDYGESYLAHLFGPDGRTSEEAALWRQQQRSLMQEIGVDSRYWPKSSSPLLPSNVGSTLEGRGLGEGPKSKFVDGAPKLVVPGA